MAVMAFLTELDFNNSVSNSAVCGVIVPVVESVPKLPYLAACAGGTVTVTACHAAIAEIVAEERNEARVELCDVDGSTNNAAFVWVGVFQNPDV
jgi:hypothetical protein